MRILERHGVGVHDLQADPLRSSSVEEPLWSTDKSFILDLDYPHLYRWVTDTPQLSPFLRLSTPNLTNQVISESLEILWPAEAACLGVESGWVRSICLRAAGVPWVYARVCVGLPSYYAHQSTFDGLKEDLLGESVLYQKKGWTKGQRLYAPVYKGATLMEELTETLGELLNVSEFPARRTLFSLGDSSLLVTEVFLPGLPSFPEGY